MGEKAYNPELAAKILRHCVLDDGGCAGCPGLRDGPCMSMAVRGVLKGLEELEKQVSQGGKETKSAPAKAMLLTIVDIPTFANPTMIEKKGDYLVWGFYQEIRNGKMVFVHQKTGDDEVGVETEEFKMNEYNVTWRCWDRLPLSQQRGRTKWMTV